MAAKKNSKRKVITTISALQFERNVPDADASLVAKEKAKNQIEIKEIEKEVVKEIIKEIEVVKEVPVEVIKQIEVIKEVPKEVIKEIIKEIPTEIIKEVEVVKEIEVIKEVPKEVIREVEVVKEIEVIKEVEIIKEVEVVKEIEVIKEVPKEVIKEIEVIKEVEIIKEVPVEVIREVEIIKEVPATQPISFEEFISDLKPSYGTNAVAQNSVHDKIDETFKDESQDLNELETKDVQEITEPIEEESRLQKLYKHHARIRAFELYFRGVCVYSSLTYRVAISFHKDYAMINEKRYNYADGLQMKFY